MTGELVGDGVVAVATVLSAIGGAWFSVSMESRRRSREVWLVEAHRILNEWLAFQEAVEAQLRLEHHLKVLPPRAPYPGPHCPLHVLASIERATRLAVAVLELQRGLRVVESRIATTHNPNTSAKDIGGPAGDLWHHCLRVSMDYQLAASSLTAIMNHELSARWPTYSRACERRFKRLCRRVEKALAHHAPRRRWTRLSRADLVAWVLRSPSGRRTTRPEDMPAEFFVVTAWVDYGCPRGHRVIHAVVGGRCENCVKLGLVTAIDARAQARALDPGGRDMIVYDAEEHVASKV